MKKILLCTFLCLFFASRAQNFVVSASQQPKCFGACDGWITFTTSAVNGTFTAVVSNASTCPNSTVQSSTMNSITIYSICACGTDYSFSIYNPSMAVVGTMIYQFPIYATAPFTVNTTTLGATGCFTCCDGYAYLTSGGGNPNGTPTYSMDGQWITGISPASSLCVGQHTVCAADPSGCIACKVFTINAPSGINEISAKQNYKIYPNPTSDFIVIENPGNENISEISVYDMSGRLISRLNPIQQHEKILLRMGDLPEGVYQLILYNESHEMVSANRVAIAKY